MYTEEMCKEEYRKHRTKYFKLYFENKNINEAIYNSFRKNVISLSGAYLNFLIMCDCLEIISKNKDYKKNTNLETKMHVRNVIKGIKSIYCIGIF